MTSFQFAWYCETLNDYYYHKMLNLLDILMDGFRMQNFIIKNAEKHVQWSKKLYNWKLEHFLCIHL